MFFLRYANNNSIKKWTIPSDKLYIQKNFLLKFLSVKASDVRLKCFSIKAEKCFY